MCDMTAEFYLQTVDVVFQRHLLPKGELDASRSAGRSRPRSATRRCWRSRASATTSPGIGQTRAALDIATRLPAAGRSTSWPRDVGHYGIFNGRKWRERIAPVVEKFIAAND